MPPLHALKTAQVSALIVSVLVAPGAFSQTAAPTPQAAASQPSGALETIVVTAQKRTESAQRVGVAVSVLSGDELAARGVRKVNALQNEVPNLEIEPAFGGGQAQFRLRGVGFQDYATNNAGAVTVYVDEVALPLPVQTQGLLFDIDRVEVLRGPQGTLYGRNTTGGAVNFITRAPTARFEGGAMVGFGSFGAKEAEAFVSGALAEGLRGRIALATQQGGAWQRNRVTGEKLGDKDVTGVRGQLAFDATRDLKINLSLHLGRDKSDAQGLYLFTAQPAVPAGDPFNPPKAYAVAKPAFPADTDRRATGWGFAPAFLAAIGKPANAKPSFDNDTNGVSMSVNWNLGDTLLTSITAYNRFKRKELADYDGTGLPLAETYFDSRSRNLSQELRLASNGPDATFNWLAGLYYANETLDEAYWSSFANSFGFPTLRTSYNQKVDTTSVFGQADYRLAPDLKLVAGLRQEREKREGNDFATVSIGPDIPFFGPANSATTNNHTSGKLSLEYQASRQLLAYGSISRGVKSGGFTAYNTFNALQLTPFKPEVLVAYEAGFKADPSAGLRINGAVFHYDYRNQQILDAVPNPINPSSPLGALVNAPKSEINGVELEMAWRPSAALTLTQFVGYKDGKFRQYTAISPPADLAGKPLYFPRLSYGAAVAWQGLVGSWAVTAQADASFHDKSRTFLNRINTDFDFSTPSYWLANARIEMSPVDAKWRATVYVRNLFDQKYDLTRNFFDPPLPAAAAGAPRTAGLQVRYEF